MKDAFVITLSASLAVVVTLSLFLVSALQSQRATRAQNQQLAARIKALEEQVATLCEVTNALARDIQAARQLKSAPEPAPAKAEADQAPAEQAGPKVAPFQVPVYLGQKLLGLAWAVPTQVKRDTQTGRVTYQPVIRLPETVQSALTTYVTNVVERPAPTAPPVPPPGYYQYYHYRWWPWWGGAAVAVRMGPDRPQPAPVSGPAVPRVSVGGPWTPVAIAAPTPARPGILAPPSPGSPGLFVPPGLR